MREHSGKRCIRAAEQIRVSASRGPTPADEQLQLPEQLFRPENEGMAFVVRHGEQQRSAQNA